MDLGVLAKYIGLGLMEGGHQKGIILFSVLIPAEDAHGV